jgi:hypothetical protein
VFEQRFDVRQDAFVRGFRDFGFGERDFAFFGFFDRCFFAFGDRVKLVVRADVQRDRRDRFPGKGLARDRPQCVFELGQATVFVVQRELKGRVVQTRRFARHGIDRSAESTVADHRVGRLARAAVVDEADPVFFRFVDVVVDVGVPVFERFRGVTDQQVVV